MDLCTEQRFVKSVLQQGERGSPNMFCATDAAVMASMG